jgi:hypothetical protein
VILPSQQQETAVVAIDCKKSGSSDIALPLPQKVGERKTRRRENQRMDRKGRKQEKINMS